MAHYSRLLLRRGSSRRFLSTDSLHVSGCEQPIPFRSIGTCSKYRYFRPISQQGHDSIFPISPRFLQIRFVSKKRAKLQRKLAGTDPFVILQVAEGTSYNDVKKVFLRIAMTNHPDTSNAATEEEKDRCRELFVGARKAFEQLVEGDDGIAVLKSDQDGYQEEDLDQWFKEQTGYDMPWLDAATLKEVAEMTDKVSIGLDRDGGMWTLAKTISANIKGGGTGDVLRLEAGEERDRNIDGILRRRRRQR